MRMVRTVAPTQYPLSLVEVKSYCRIYHTDWDADFDRLIAAITQRLDGYEGILGRALMRQTWTMYLDGFDDEGIEIPLPPFVSIDAFQYLEYDDNWVDMVVNTDYIVDTPFGDQWAAKILPAYNTCFPSAKDVSNSVKVTFTAGWAPGTFPESIKQGMLMTISAWNENRETQDIPESARNLFFPYRRIPV